MPKIRVCFRGRMSSVEGHNAALRGAEPASSAERPLEGTVIREG